MTVRDLLLPGLLACAWAAPAQAQADPVRELDALIDRSGDPASAMALARSQIGEGDLLGAAATLERVLIDFPDADDALLLHASLLCRLDDRPGARAELASLNGVAGSGAAWAEVTAACGPVPRPGRGE